MNDRVDGLSILLIIVSAFVLLVAIYVMFFYRYDRHFVNDTEERIRRMRDGPLSRLLNGSSINNIPTLRLVKAPPQVARANHCADGPVSLSGSHDTTDTECARVCVNDGARAINVHANDIVVFNSIVLHEGAHCYVGPRPDCNMRTAIALLTINSVTCRSRFPKLVGGRTGNDIVACNDNNIRDPQNVLWDYKENAMFDPFRTSVTDEDELLADGTYRFRCKFNGVDSNSNVYQAHPVSRLHAIEKYCASAIYAAHPAVRTVFSDDGRTFSCDCGDFSETRVRPIDPNDSRSRCSVSCLTARHKRTLFAQCALSLLHVIFTTPRGWPLSSLSR